MSFDDDQTRRLKAKLKRRHVKTRTSNGETLPYLEGWHAISEANRIFGFGYWDRQTLAPHCHWANQQSGQTVCFYSTKVRVTVRAGSAVIIREGMGTGLGRSQQAEIAHDIAIKSAETDATKRALATFGNAFGLALYDPEQSHVTKSRTDNKRLRLVLTSLSGEEKSFPDLQTFTDAVLGAIDQTQSVDDLYAFWAANVGALKAFDQQADGKAYAARIVESIKHRARQIVATPLPSKAPEAPAIESSQRATSFLRPKEKRIRDRAHLAFVATQPCLICGRQPTQAHHLRFAQQTAMGMKVSDEFTVPLCITHHDQLHRKGDERAYWKSNGIPDPLKHAAKLWSMSHPRTDQSEWNPDTEEEFNEPSLRKRSPDARSSE